MYNNKPRQAEGFPGGKAGGRRAASRRRRERPMLTMNVLNDILGLYIILVLVLVTHRNRIVRLVMRESRVESL